VGWFGGLVAKDCCGRRLWADEVIPQWAKRAEFIIEGFQFDDCSLTGAAGWPRLGYEWARDGGRDA